MFFGRDRTDAAVQTLPRNFLRRLYHTSRGLPRPSPPPSSPMSTSSLSISRNRSPSPASTVSSVEPGDDFSRRTGTTLTSPFYRASNFVLNSPVIQHHVQNEAHLNLTLERLARHIMPGASFDYATKDPPPRCYPGTRRYIIDKAKDWFYLPYRARSIMWLSGPAGVGKTAIMRTLADAESASRRLGATIFFSRYRQNKRDGIGSFVPTLVYQLAVELLDKGMKELFQTLIVEPFGRQNLCGGLGHKLILIDGLDECNGGEHAQQEIIEMIGDFVERYPTSPLVWIIASRSEPHLRAAFSRPSVAAVCWHEHIAIDTPEACGDVEVYLQGEFTKMRQQFTLLMPQDQDWPSKSQVVLIVRAASGLFIFASTVVRFISDPKVGNPVKQLEVVIRAIEKIRTSTVPRSDSPLVRLHDLYSEILGNVSRPTYGQFTGRILGCCDLLPRNTAHSTPFMLSCNFLGISQNDAYASLQRLHSVLDVPSHLEATFQEVKILHSSFSDFLRSRSASREFHIGRPQTATDIVRCSFRILQQVNSSAGPFPHLSKISLTWEHQPEKMREVLLRTAYDGFRLMTLSDRGLDVSFTLDERVALLAQADFSKLDCYLPPDIKTSVYDTRTHHKCLFDWLLSQWKSNPQAFKRSELVKELPLKQLDKRSIRTDRAVIHFRFTEKDGSVVRPKVYSDCREIREKFKGDTLDAFEKVLKPHRHGSPSKQIQMWGKDPAKTCLLFECRPAPGCCVDGKLAVKEIFFIPYAPRKK